jgi:uncharacterized cupredoxin-like copper-binding protein
LIVFEASKQDIIIQAEIDEDEETIEWNLLFEIDEVRGGESGESEVMDLTKGSYVIGCLIPGHWRRNERYFDYLIMIGKKEFCKY